MAIFGAVFGKLKQCVATFGDLWYFLHLIGNCLESNFKENKADWKAIGKRLESDWNITGKQLKIFGISWSSFWQIKAMGGIIWYVLGA